MMKHSILNNFFKLFFVVLFTLISLPALADDDTGFDDNVDDETDAPIDSYLLPLLIAGVATGYVAFSRKKKAI